MSNDKHIYIPLENVDSEHCALIVEQGLKEIDKIDEISVETNNRRLKISSEDLDEAIPLAVQKIRDLGYGVPTVKKHYPVLNLSCTACATSTQNILKYHIGVVSAHVNYANTEAIIEYIPSLTSPEELKAALQSAGYDLMIDESDDAHEDLDSLQQKKYESLKKKTIWAIVLAVPLMLIGKIGRASCRERVVMLEWGAEA